MNAFVLIGLFVYKLTREPYVPSPDWGNDIAIRQESSPIAGL
jgi:hypothetical protein